MKATHFAVPMLRPLAAALMLAASLAAPLAHAQTAPAGSTAPAGQRHGAKQQLALQAIGATAAQQSQIQAILKLAHSDVQALRKAAGNLRLQLAQVLAAPTVDATAAETVRQQILAEQNSTSLRMLQAKLQVASVLTAAQRQQLLSYEQQQRAKWQGRQAAGA